MVWFGVESCVRFVFRAAREGKGCRHAHAPYATRPLVRIGWFFLCQLPTLKPKHMLQGDSNENSAFRYFEPKR